MVGDRKYGGMHIMKKRVIVAGHICVDITPVFPEGKGRNRNVSDVMKPGKLLHMDGVQVSTGGVVANTGLAMKFLGADVKLIGKIGEDSFGEIVANTLKKNGAEDDSLVRDPSVSTSYTVVVAIPGIDRIFLHDPGANDQFFSKDISDVQLREADHIHFGYPPLMAKMFEEDGRELIDIYRRAKEFGLSTSLDMAAVDPNAPSGGADWEKILNLVLPYVDFFVPSFEELCFMLDRPKFDALADKANGGDMTEVISFEEDVKPLADKCLKLGAKLVVIKCGIAGLFYKSSKEETMRKIPGIDAVKWAELEGFEKSYVPDVVRSGTGAGDTCIAAFLTALLDGEEPEMVFSLATGTGASCVEGYDSLSGLRTFDELKKKIGNGWEKLSV